MAKIKTQLETPEKAAPPVTQDTLPEQPVKEGPRQPQRAALMRMREMRHPESPVRDDTKLASEQNEPAGVSGRPIQKQPAARPPITTPVPAEAEITPEGDATLELAGVDVIIAPDAHTNDDGMRDRAETDFSITGDIPRHDFTGNKVTAIGKVPRPVMRIQTTYGPGATSGSPSGCGRGTTPEDIRAGRTTLGHHEGSHGLDFLEYLRDHPVPAFGGRTGMTRRQFALAVSRYQKGLLQYKRDLDKFSQKRTDLVGVKGGHCEKQPGRK